MKTYLEKDGGFLFLRVREDRLSESYNLLYMKPSKKWLAPGWVYAPGLKLDGDGRIIVE